MGNAGCFKFRRRQEETDESKAYEPLLHQEEKDAVNNLLKYYDEGTSMVHFAVTVYCSSWYRKFPINKPFTRSIKSLDCAKLFRQRGATKDCSLLLLRD